MVSQTIYGVKEIIFHTKKPYKPLQRLSFIEIDPITVSHFKELLRNSVMFCEGWQTRIKTPIDRWPR